MRRFLTSTAVALAGFAMAGLGFAGCGGTDAVHSATSRTPSDASVVAGTGGVLSVASGPAALRGLKGDDDDDDNGENLGTSKYDNDADFDNDLKNENVSFYDADDRVVRSFSHRPDPIQAAELTVIAKRYFKSAATGDGAAACSMFTQVWVKSVPEDYGRGAGPSYARGDTCAKVMSLIFEHRHSQWQAGGVLVAVRQEGEEALAIVGFKAMPVAYLLLVREGGRWVIGAPFLTTLP